MQKRSYILVKRVVFDHYLQIKFNEGGKMIQRTGMRLGALHHQDTSTKLVKAWCDWKLFCYNSALLASVK